MLPAEATSCWVGITPAEDQRLITAHQACWTSTGVPVYDRPSNKVTKVVTLNPIEVYNEAWYKTGTASARCVSRTFTGVSFSPDGKALIYCSDQGDTGLFNLYTVPVDGGDAKEVKDAKMSWPTSTEWMN